MSHSGAMTMYAKSLLSLVIYPFMRQRSSAFVGLYFGCEGGCDGQGSREQDFQLVVWGASAMSGDHEAIQKLSWNFTGIACYPVVFVLMCWHYVHGASLFVVRNAS